MSIATNIQTIRTSLPQEVKLLCVSKYHTIEEIQEAYNAGERCFAESRVKELQEKYAALPQDIEWHFIGHLQTNKIRPLLPMVSLIHGVDSLYLLEAIEKEAEKQDISQPINVLLEVKVAQENTKYGFTPEQLRQIKTVHTPHPKVCIAGIMGMASNTTNEKQIAQEFQTLYEVFEDLKQTIPTVKVLSMGMSNDYHIAIQHGSNLVRIGSAIFNNA